MPPKRKAPASNGGPKKFRKGYDRTGGVYGRFGSPPRRGAAQKEKKFFDTSVDFSYDTVGEVPATGQLILIPQGVTESTRIGRKAFIHSLYIKGTETFVPAASAEANGSTYLYLVLDTQANGAAAAVTDVFDATGLSRAIINLNNSLRFRIIKKWVHTWNVSGGVTGAYNSATKVLNEYIRFSKPIPVDYSSTTGALSEIRSNNLFLVAGANGIDDLVTVGATCRVRFTD